MRYDFTDPWRFIRQFAAEWTSALTPEDGYPDAELGRMPEALRQAYRLFGRREDLTRTQDRLASPAEIEYDEVLVFRWENQACTAWGVTDPDHPDPPVLFRVGDEWRPFLDSVSLACVEMALTETLFAVDKFADNMEVSDAATVRSLERDFTRVPFPDYPMWAIPQGPPIRWYFAEDCLLRCDAEEWLWVIARTPEALARVYETVPGDWLLRPDE